MNIDLDVIRNIVYKTKKKQINGIWVVNATMDEISLLYQEVALKAIEEYKLGDTEDNGKVYSYWKGRNYP